MADMTVAFIGLGLIGGSMARGIKRSNPNTTVMAYMRTRKKLEQAKKEGIVDIILNGIDEHLSLCDFIFLCTPVEYNAEYLAAVKPYLKPHTIVSDVGSTKSDIHRQVINLGMEDCFIGGHPMAGSEKTGYENSTDHLLENAYYIISPTAHTTDEKTNRLISFAEDLGAIPMVMDYKEHDIVVATISHLPHIVASGLVDLVKSSDSEQGIMKQVAAGGFKDITRIASSSPVMWEQICSANSDNICIVLKNYINSLTNLLHSLEAHDSKAIYNLFESSREYRNSITDKVKGSLEPDYSFTIDIVDEPGAISTLAVILSAKGISMKNIGINHNREHGEGALRITFYNKESMTQAWEQLKKYNYELIKSL